MNYFAVAQEAVRRAAARRIELLPTPPEQYYDPDTGERSADDPFAGPNFVVALDTPRGHYLTLRGDTAQVVVVDDFRAGAGVYDDLIPGFALVAIERLPVLDADGRPMPEHADRIFVGITYAVPGTWSHSEWLRKCAGLPITEEGAAHLRRLDALLGAARRKCAGLAC